VERGLLDDAAFDIGEEQGDAGHAAVNRSGSTAKTPYSPIPAERIPSAINAVLPASRPNRFIECRTSAAAAAAPAPPASTRTRARD
jgi:hypothetical protein